MEILDNVRERKPLPLGAPEDRVHLVVEVDDIEAERVRLKLDAPQVQETSWGARLFQLRDPDGVPVTFLQWIRKEGEGASNAIRGRLATGKGRGQHFTGLDWARGQFVDKLGIDPFPGTVNVVIDEPESMASWERLKEGSGVISIDNPNGGPGDCSARCFPVSIEGRFDAAIVLPDVAGYPPDQIEVIAATGIRDALGINDGDPVTLEIKQTTKEHVS